MSDEVVKKIESDMFGCPEAHPYTRFKCMREFPHHGELDYHWYYNFSSDGYEEWWSYEIGVDPLADLRHICGKARRNPWVVSATLRFAAHTIRQKYGTDNQSAKTLDFYAEKVEADDFEW